eukprot:2235910-Alexandrium_andersonii.AAC.1
MLVSEPRQVCCGWHRPLRRSFATVQLYSVASSRGICPAGSPQAAEPPPWLQAAAAPFAGVGEQ